MVPLAFKETIIWRLQVQSSLQVSNNTGILNTCTWLWLMKSEQATPVDSIKDVVQSSMKVPEFDKHLKKAGGHIGRNVVEIKMKTIVWKPLILCHFFSWSLILGWILMKKCLDHSANQENLDLSRFFPKIGLIRLKRPFKNYFIFFFFP